MEVRSRATPKIIWEKQVTNYIKAMGITSWKEKVKNRRTWRKIANDAKKHNHL